MNRHQRRAQAAAQGVPWRGRREAERFVRQAQEMEAKGLTMTPDQARAALARWAAVGGRIPLEEVQREEQIAGVTLADFQGKTDAI